MGKGSKCLYQRQDYYQKVNKKVAALPNIPTNLRKKRKFYLYV